MAKKGKQAELLTGDALVKETCRRIRVARSYWDAHNNRACRGEREKALQLYNTLSKDEKDKIPQQLRVWLRYRSEKYFGSHNAQQPNSQRRSKRNRNRNRNNHKTHASKLKDPRF